MTIGPMRSGPVLVIDRLALVRRALRAMLGARDVLAAPDVEAALLVAGGRRPDAVVVGPGQAATAAAEIVRRLHEALPRVPVVVITARSETRWLSDRVHGIGAECVREDAPAGELARVLRRVAGGGAAASGGLSARELQVLHLIALGHTNPEIAARLSLSVRTVESHRAALLRKLSVTSRAGLVREALNLELVT